MNRPYARAPAGTRSASRIAGENVSGSASRRPASAAAMSSVGPSGRAVAERYRRGESPIRRDRMTNGSGANRYERATVAIAIPSSPNGRPTNSAATLPAAPVRLSHRRYFGCPTAVKTAALKYVAARTTPTSATIRSTEPAGAHSSPKSRTIWSASTLSPTKAGIATICTIDTARTSAAASRSGLSCSFENEGKVALPSAV